MVIILLIKKAEIYISIQHSLERKILMTGILIFHVVAEPQNSGKSAKSCEIHNNTQNAAKFGKNLIKYMSVQHIWNFFLRNLSEAL